jgi:hypothetical protein
MLTLFLCLLLLLLPVAGLWFFYPRLTKGTRFPFILKLAMGVIFFSVGLAVTYVAVLLQINMLSSHGINDMSSARMLIPMGIVINALGVVYILFLRKN